MDSGLRRNTRGGDRVVVWIVGTGIPLEGAPNYRAPPRPTKEELLVALREFHPVSDASRKLHTWLCHLAAQ